MKGKILGANADGGTISAEDGKRYKFELMQWNSDRPPVAGQDVDFEVEGEGRAVGVFPLRGGANIELGQVGDKVKGLIGDGASSPIGGQIIALATGSAQFQISLVILLASFLVTFVKATGGIVAGAAVALPDDGAYSVFNISDLIDYLKSSLDQGATSLQQVSGILGGASAILNGGTPTNAPSPQSIIDSLHALSSGANLFYIAYLVPIGALAVIVQSIRKQATGLLSFITGIAAILAFVSMLGWRMALVSTMKSGGNTSAADMAGEAIRFGLGAYVILICGLLLTGAAFGFIKLPEKR